MRFYAASSLSFHCWRLPDGKVVVCRCLIETQADLRYIVDAVDCIIRSRLVAMQQYDVHLSNMLDPTLPSGVNYVAVMFAMQLVQRFCLDDKLSAQVHWFVLACLHEPCIVIMLSYL